MTIGLGGRDHGAQEMARQRLLARLGRRVERGSAGRRQHRYRSLRRLADGRRLLAGLPVVVRLVGERSDRGHAAELESLTADLSAGLATHQQRRQATGEHSAAGPTQEAATAALAAGWANALAALTTHELFQQTLRIEHDASLFDQVARSHDVQLWQKRAFQDLFDRNAAAANPEAATSMMPASPHRTGA